MAAGALAIAPEQGGPVSPSGAQVAKGISAGGERRPGDGSTGECAARGSGRKLSRPLVPGASGSPLRLLLHAFGRLGFAASQSSIAPGAAVTLLAATLCGSLGLLPFVAFKTKPDVEVSGLSVEGSTLFHT